MDLLLSGQASTFWNLVFRLEIPCHLFHGHPFYPFMSVDPSDIPLKHLKDIWNQPVVHIE